MVVTPGESGLRLQVEAALGALESWLARGRRGPVALTVEAAPPEVSSPDLAGVDGVVASYSTSVAGTRNRRHNVALAAKALDGVTVKPGAVFSYNRVVGPRTTEAGYKTAPVIIRGELVPGIGGGACQVSSTLYNAALLANMRVVRRSHHSHPIGYVPAGRDATVVYEMIDLRLGNPSPHPLVFQTRLAGRRLTVMVLGKRGGAPVRVFSSRSAVSAGPPMMREDPTLAPGVQVMERPAQEGVRARVVRVIGEGEAAREEVVSSDFYRPSRAIVRVGPSAPGEPAPAAPPAVTPPQ